MQKILITYEAYDRMIEHMDLFHLNPQKVIFSEEDIELMIETDLEGYLSLLLWIMENSKNKRIYQMINRMLYQKIIFVEKKQVDIKCTLSVERCKKIYAASNLIADPLEVQIPMITKIEANFADCYDYMFGMYIWILRKAKAEEKRRDRFHRFLKNHYQILNEQKKGMQQEEYEQLKKKLKNHFYQRGSWLPTREETKEYILPNMDICYDFVIWLLEGGKEARSEEQKEILLALKKAIQDYVIITDDKEMDWW